MIWQHLVEVMTRPLHDNTAEEMEPFGDEEWRRQMAPAALCPGIGVNDSTECAPLVAGNLRFPTDADGLNNPARKSDCVMQDLPILRTSSGRDGLLDRLR
jgi:hypothetical protein